MLKKFKNNVKTDAGIKRLSSISHFQMKKSYVCHFSKTNKTSLDGGSHFQCLKVVFSMLTHSLKWYAFKVNHLLRFYWSCCDSNA